MSYYFGFNTPEEQKKKRKSDLTAIGEKVTSFFWILHRPTVLRCEKANRICLLRLWMPLFMISILR